MKKLLVLAEVTNWGRNFSLQLGWRHGDFPDVPDQVAQPLTFVPRDPDVVETYGHAPAITMSREDVQSLMDELWRIGVRPSEGTGSAGSLAATERHLKDMQRITFSLLRDEQSVADQQRELGVTVREVRP